MRPAMRMYFGPFLRLRHEFKVEAATPICLAVAAVSSVSFSMLSMVTFLIHACNRMSVEAISLPQQLTTIQNVTYACKRVSPRHS